MTAQIERSGFSLEVAFKFVGSCAYVELSPQNGHARHTKKRPCTGANMNRGTTLIAEGPYTEKNQDELNENESKNFCGFALPACRYLSDI